jgi:SH3-like domain-containing protein
MILAETNGMVVIVKYIREKYSMKRTKLSLYFIVFCLLYGQGSGLAETMYVTDRLYLSLRNAPEPEAPSLALLPSDTKVDVLEMEDNWAKVTLKDGRTGWVIKRFLVKELPKSLIIEQLQNQIQNKNISLERLREENASLKEEIETLRNQIIKQNERIVTTTKENTLGRLKEIYAPVIVVLLVGLNIGCLLVIRYLVRRLKRGGY